MSAALLMACGHASPPVVERPAPHLRGEDGHRHASAPLPDPARVEEVGLSALLAFADVHSPVLRVSRSSRARSRAAADAASQALPENLEVAVAAGPRLRGADVGLDLEASISQRFEIGGERGARLDAADRLHDLTEARIEETRWLVHCEVHASFHRALVMRERARLAGAVATFQESLFHIAERQAAAGQVAPLTLRLAQAEVAQARQASVAAEQDYLAARIELAQLSGWPAARPPLPLGSLDAPRDPPALEVLVRRARQHLPSLAVRQTAVREARARLDAAERELWPDPAISVEYAYESDPGEQDPTHILRGGLTLPIPSFDLNRAERAEAHADIAVAEAEAEATAFLLDGEIAAARSAMVAAAERVRSYGTEVLPRFEENLTLLTRAFELGEIDLLELSIGRERFLRIQSDALSAQLDYFVALANLERTIGAELWRDEHGEEP
jgi:cobalt-zinc-cadmium efflux system outer membrane protein